MTPELVAALEGACRLTGIARAEVAGRAGGEVMEKLAPK